MFLLCFLAFSFSFFFNHAVKYFPLMPAKGIMFTQIVNIDYEDYKTVTRKLVVLISCMQ